jgi:hypothetical protein
MRLICLSLLLVAAGCGRLPRPSYPITDAGEALRAQRLAVEPLNAFRAEARIDQREGARRIRGTVLMIVERPDRVRIDAMTRLGAAATLTSDGERFALLDLREGRFFVGESCASNVARGLGVAIAPAELVRFLIGDAPLFHESAATIEPVRGGYRVEISGEDGSRQIIELALPAEEIEAAPGRQRPMLKSTTLFDARGKRALRVTFGAHRPVQVGEARIMLPHEIRLEEAGQGTDILLRYKSIEPVDEAPPGAFEQLVPSGLSPEHLPCHP